MSDLTCPVCGHDASLVTSRRTHWAYGGGYNETTIYRYECGLKHFSGDWCASPTDAIRSYLNFRKEMFGNQ